MRLKTDGGNIALSEDTLCKHTLLIGSTGSGKTTTLNVILRDLIRYHSDDPKRKMGLLVFDFKGDRTYEKICRWASEVGRENDVVDFSADSNHYYNPFLKMKRFEDISLYADMLAAVAPQNDRNNAYWYYALNKRLRTILEILFLSKESPNFENFMDIVRSFTHANGSFVNFIAGLRGSAEMSKAECSDPTERAEFAKIARRICNLQSELDDWMSLDSRTRSNEVSTLTNVTGCFTSENVGQFFEARERKVLDLESVLGGKIIVVTICGTTDLALASSLSKLLKVEFYRHIQNREVDFCDKSRLCGIVMDEFPLVATGGEDTSSDVLNMQTMRSKKSFVLAATQGLISLDLKVGMAARMAMMANFNSLFVFRSSEAEVQRLAENFIRPQKSSAKQIGFMAESENMQREIPESQSTDQLQTGYAYVRIADGEVFDRALKMPRLFVDLPPSERVCDSVDKGELQERCLRIIRSNFGGVNPAIRPME